MTVSTLFPLHCAYTDQHTDAHNKRRDAHRHTWTDIYRCMDELTCLKHAIFVNVLISTEPYAFMARSQWTHVISFRLFVLSFPHLKDSTQAKSESEQTLFTHCNADAKGTISPVAACPRPCPVQCGKHFFEKYYILSGYSAMLLHHNIMTSCCAPPPPSLTYPILRPFL